METRLAALHPSEKEQRRKEKEKRNREEIPPIENSTTHSLYIYPLCASPTGEADIHDGPFPRAPVNYVAAAMRVWSTPFTDMPSALNVGFADGFSTGIS
jgi:hypothetical protein